MKTITRTFIPDDENQPARQFECHISDVLGCGSFVEVSAWEVRPVRKWWQSRTRYFGSKCFWVDDFDTIKAGIDSVLAKLMEEEAEDLARRKKFEEFEKSA